MPVKWSPQDVIDAFQPYLQNAINEQKIAPEVNQSSIFKQISAKAQQVNANRQTEQGRQ